MSNAKKLNSLLARGRQLQKEIDTFFNKGFDLSSSHCLITGIDKLIDDIKPKLLNSSTTEDHQMSLVIIHLGSIVKNLNAIKLSIQKASGALGFRPPFFKPKNSNLVLSNEKNNSLNTAREEFNTDLNQLENILQQTATHTSQRPY